MKFFTQTLFFFLLTTQICFGQWTQIGLNGEVIKDIAVQNQNIFVVTEDIGQLYRSTDNGATYTMIVDSNVVDVAISTTGKVFMSKDSLFGDPWNRSLYSSLDNGVSWTWFEVLPNLNTDYWPISISVSPMGYLFIGVRIQFGPPHTSGFTLSTDDGLTWVDSNVVELCGGYLFDFRDQHVITYGNWGHFSGAGESFLSSMDYGITWNGLDFQGDLPSYPVALGLFTNGNIVTGIAGMYWGTTNPDSGIYIYTEFDSIWTQIAEINCKSGLSWSSGSSEGMLIGTEDLGVFLFSDNGDSLGTRNEGLTNLDIHTLTLDNNGYVYAGTDNGVWRRPLSEVTSVKDEPTQPTEFILSQSYPNPFNSSCAIRYSIPQLSQVSLKVFNTLGEEIQTLVNEEKPVGTYEITWYAEQLPSGVYFYQLKAREYTAVKKMMLLK